MMCDCSGASFRGADFAGTVLFGANFEGADLADADLSGAVGLTPEQLDGALGNGGTSLPPGMAGLRFEGEPKP